MSNLPPHVKVEVRRILDGVARRLLEEENAKALGSASRRDTNLTDNGSNQGALLSEFHEGPVGGGNGLGGNKVTA